MLSYLNASSMLPIKPCISSTLDVSFNEPVLGVALPAKQQHSNLLLVNILVSYKLYCFITFVDL